MLPQTYMTRIGALEQRIADLRRLCLIAGVISLAALGSIWLFFPPGTGFAVGFQDRVIVPLRLITGPVPALFEPANRAVFSRGQGALVMALLNFAFLGTLIDRLRIMASLSPRQALAVRAGAAALGAAITALPWIMIAGLTAWVERRRILTGTRPGKRTWLSSLAMVLFGIFFILPPFLVILQSFSGGMDYTAQSQLKTISPAVVSALPADQEDAIGSDQLHFVRAQAAWIERRPDAMTRELAQIGGAWHPALLTEKTRLGFMAEMAGSGLSDRQHKVIVAMGADNASYIGVRNGRTVLGLMSLLSGVTAVWLAQVLIRRGAALRRFAETIVPIRQGMPVTGGADGALA